MRYLTKNRLLYFYFFEKKSPVPVQQVEQLRKHNREEELKTTTALISDWTKWLRLFSQLIFGVTSGINVAIGYLWLIVIGT